MWSMGMIPFAPYSLAPQPPLGVPGILSLAFWGGVWGVVIAAIAMRKPGWSPILIGLVVGAVGCVVVGFTIVAGLRGQALFGAWEAGRWMRSMVINGAWGAGAGFLYWAMTRARTTA